MEHEIEKEEEWQIVCTHGDEALTVRKYSEGGWLVRVYRKNDCSKQFYIPDPGRTWSIE